MIEAKAAHKLGELVARAQGDADFARRLMEDTAGTLRGEGVDFPNWLQFYRIENGEPLFRLAPLNASAELSDADLDRVAGGDNGKDGMNTTSAVINRGTPKEECVA